MHLRDSCLLCRVADVSWSPMRGLTSLKGSLFLKGTLPGDLVITGV